MRFITHTEKRSNGWYSIVSVHMNNRLVDRLFAGPYMKQMTAMRNAETLTNSLFLKWTETETEDFRNIKMEL